MKVAILLAAIILLSKFFSYSQSNNIIKNDKFSLRITIGGHKAGDSMSIDELKQNPKLIPDRDAFEILSFRWGSSGFAAGFIQFDIAGDSFPEKDFVFFGKGRFIFIDNIKAKNKIDQIVYLAPFNIKIVDKN